MLEIKPLDDVMHYFNWAFMAYSVLFLTVCLNLFKACYIRRHSISKEKRLMQFIDLFIDVLCGLAMYGGLMFLGVLADNNATGCLHYFKILSFISITSFIIFIINCIIVLKPQKHTL